MFSNWWGLQVIEVYNQQFPNLPNAGRVALAAWLAWIVVSIVLHELAHGWMAIRCGDDTPRLMGHMTLDPIKHMGLYSLVALAVCGITWGAMPVNVENLRRRHDDALVALAGPLTNVLLAVLCLVGSILAKMLLTGNAMDYASIVFFLGLVLNATLAAFNMLPVPPLDGSKVLASFVPAYRDFIYTPGAAIVGLVFVFTMGGIVIAPVVSWVRTKADVIERAVLHALGYA